MSSARRIAASRANGKKSHGPVTPEGKARSAANAVTRHGLASVERTAQSVCLANESREEFAALLLALIAEHAPATTTGHLIVEEMAVARWRMQRAWVIEGAMMDGQMDKSAPGFQKKYEVADEGIRTADAFADLTKESPSLAVLLRYESRLSRQFDRCVKRLAALRAVPAIVGLPTEPNPKNEHSPDPQPQPAQPVAAPNPAPSKERTGLHVAQLAHATPQVDGVRLSVQPADRDPLPGPPPPLPRAA
jgi:hypothetical protein